MSLFILMVVLIAVFAILDYLIGLEAGRMFLSDQSSLYRIFRGCLVLGLVILALALSLGFLMLWYEIYGNSYVRFARVGFALHFVLFGFCAVRGWIKGTKGI